MEKKEKKKESDVIELPTCELRGKDGEVVCKVSEELWRLIGKITTDKPVRRITFVVKEEE